MKVTKQFKTVNMTSGKPVKLIVLFAIPLMFGNIFQQVYTLTDAAIVGRVLGVAALSALGGCDLLVWTVNTVLQAFTEGFSIKIAVCFGARDNEQLHKTITTAGLLSCAAIVIIGTAMELMIPLILRIMKVQASIYPYAFSYLRILWLGIPFVTLYNYFFAILRALGNSKVPLWVMTGSAFLNIVLDVLFVAVLKLGISGASAATVISQAASAIVSFIFVKNIIFSGDRFHSINHKIAGAMLKLSIPMSCQIVISSIGGLVVQAIVNTYDVAFIAGYTATYKIYGLLEVAAISYGYAVTTYTSQNMGAKNMNRVKSGFFISESTAVTTSLLFTALIFIAGQGLVRIFISGQENEVNMAVGVGFQFLKIMGLGLPFLYTVHITRSFVQGIGKAIIATANSFVELCARLLTVTVFSGALGHNCVFYAEPLAWAAGSFTLGLVSLYYIRKQNIS